MGGGRSTSPGDQCAPECEGNSLRRVSLRGRAPPQWDRRRICAERGLEPLQGIGGAGVRLAEGRRPLPPTASRSALVGLRGCFALRGGVAPEPD